MTRQDLEDLFVNDGGMSTADRQTYVFRDCPYIKIDVEFSPVSQVNTRVVSGPRDVIKAVSRPYLAQPRVD
jgi:hypothetical protein